ncbi:uncharacterized protein BCN122_II1472 [Burkholderia cenocepacia]|nr:uncharacterized protein BCN122_II1472 [Burkholderia cenocepacia]
MNLPSGMARRKRAQVEKNGIPSGPQPADGPRRHESAPVSA